MSDDKLRKMKKSSFMKPTLASRASSVDTTPPNVTPSVVLAASKQRRALDRDGGMQASQTCLRSLLVGSFRPMSSMCRFRNILFILI